MKKILFAFIKRKNSIHSVQRDDVCEIGIFLLIILLLGGVSRAKQLWMKLYYLQCKQFQVVDRMLFGQVRIGPNSFFGRRWNIIWAKMVLSPLEEVGPYAFTHVAQLRQHRDDSSLCLWIHVTLSHRRHATPAVVRRFLEIVKNATPLTQIRFDVSC